MQAQDDYREVQDAGELREILGVVNERAAVKDRQTLHPLQAQWIQTSPLCLLATCDAEGRMDVSPKGDPAGFTRVLDERHLAIPERPGNRRGDGFHNILSNPAVGLIYLIPGRAESLRVNGQARVLRDADFFADMVVKGHRPRLALLVELQEVFFHCPKAFMRSGLWAPETWKPDCMPPGPEIAHALQPELTSLEGLRTHYGPDYAKKLYAE